jgi:SAM-dependent methyltransferase/uncharacterized protein YbaR (Trm112 family)
MTTLECNNSSLKDVRSDVNKDEDRDTPYSCISCGAPSLRATPIEFRCGNCCRSYPIVDSIPIFTLRPAAHLAATLQALRSAGDKVRQLAIALNRVEVAQFVPATTRERGQRALLGMSANLALANAHLKSVALVLPEPLPDLEFLDRIANLGAGWSCDAMLPYFYQDWGPTEDFESAKNSIVTAFQRHLSHSEAIAVIGAGACGLVHAVADEFDQAYGVDLSIPTLLIARSVLLGHPMVVHLEHAGWAAVEVRNRESPRSNVRLAVADAINLPFQDHSLSAVLTQYVMDIVGNPRRVTAEIMRVLRPGGLWINFSLPLRLPDLPQELGSFTLDELEEFLRPLGFQLLESRHVYFKLLNVEKISEPTESCRHKVHFFVSQKPVNSVQSSEVYSRCLALVNDEGWWKSVPKISPARGAEFITTTDFGSERIDRRVEVSFGLIRIPGVGAFPRHTLEEDDMCRLKHILELIDGNRTYGEILSTIVDAKGLKVAPGDFCELFHYLADRHGLITTSPLGGFP